MDTKRDTLILELIKYLVNTDKNIPSEAQEEILKSTAGQQSVASKQDEPTNKKLEDIRSSIDVLREEIRLMGQTSKLPEAGTGKDSSNLYHEIMNSMTEDSESCLQSLFSGAFVCSGNNRDFFLWSGNRGQRVCIVLIQSEMSAVSAKALALVGSSLMLGLSSDLQQTDEIMRYLNKKITEYYNNYGSMPKKLKVGVCLIDKKQAKVFFSGAGMYIAKVDEDGIDSYEGIKEFAGLVPGQFSVVSVDIKRGCTLYLHGNNQISGEIEKVLKKTLEESGQEKKAQISKWLTKKNTGEAMIGLSF